VTEDEATIRRGEIDSLAVKADAVCRALLRIESPAKLAALLGDNPHDVAAVLLALTEWMDSAELVEMEKRTITFSAKGKIYSLLTEDDTDRMKGEIFQIVAENLSALIMKDPQTERQYDARNQMRYVVDTVKQLGAYYIAKLPAAVAAPSEGADVEGDTDTEPPP